MFDRFTEVAEGMTMRAIRDTAWHFAPETCVPMCVHLNVTVRQSF